MIIQLKVFFSVATHCFYQLLIKTFCGQYYKSYKSSIHGDIKEVYCFSFFDNLPGYRAYFLVYLSSLKMCKVSTKSSVHLLILYSCTWLLMQTLQRVFLLPVFYLSLSQFLSWSVSLHNSFSPTLFISLPISLFLYRQENLQMQERYYHRYHVY